MNNPYFKLHRQFREAGSEVLLSSGQACVALGIAAFSKDGDWIVRETHSTCKTLRTVLQRKAATYRLGAPLDPEWLALGLTSHFEFQGKDGERLRVDFCSRPPRVPDVQALWSLAARMDEIDVVDMENLIRLKMTRRLRDYSVVGALAETGGLEQGVPEIALKYLQDYQTLSEAVRRWPDDAKRTPREAVQLLVGGASRSAVVTALALEQDWRMQQDEARIQAVQQHAGDYPRRFAAARRRWRREDTPLDKQHAELKELAQCLLKM